MYHIVIYVASVLLHDKECCMECNVCRRPKVWLLTEYLIAVRLLLFKSEVYTEILLLRTSPEDLQGCPVLGPK